MAAEHDHHIAPTSMQTQHEHAASTNRALLASENHGRPAIAATAKPGEFAGHGVVAARGTTSHTVSPNGTNGHPNNAADLHKTDRPPAHTQSTGLTPSHTNTANTTHVNNSANNAPKNHAYTQNKPQMQNKPQLESKPPKEGKPR
jgi:hypothetical protein